MTVPLLLVHLGAERYGMGLSISSIVTLLAASDLGVGSGLLNRLTGRFANDEAQASRVQISSALAMLGTIASLIVLVFLLVYPAIPWAHLLSVNPAAATEAGPTALVVLIVFAIGLPASTVTQVRMAANRGTRSTSPRLWVMCWHCDRPAGVRVGAGLPVLA